MGAPESETEELKKRAVERMGKLMKEEYEEGYNDGLKLITEGKLYLFEAEQLCGSEDESHRILAELFGEGVIVERSEEYIRGFRAAVEDVLKEASEKAKKLQT